MSYSALLCTRNEERSITRCLEALYVQTPLPEAVMIVDSSSDDTAKIARAFTKGRDLAYWVSICRLPFTESLLGLPEFADTINVGLKMLCNVKSDFVLNLDADTILASDYIRKLLERMTTNRHIGIASGRKLGEPFDPDIPRNSCMLVRTALWELVGWRYPTVWGYELWLQEKAKIHSYKIGAFPDIECRSTRPYKYGKGLNDGKAMYALGYPPLYAMGRVANLGLRHPLSGLRMLYGYLTHKGVTPENTPSDVQFYVRYWANQRMRRYL